MSFEHTWTDLSMLCSAEAAGTMEWKIVYARRPRSVLVPAGDATQARAGVDFFSSSRLLRVWGRLLLVLDRWLPKGWLVPSVQLHSLPWDTIFGYSAARGRRFALHCGSPGPLQKLAVFVEELDGGKVAKIALKPSADQSVIREAYWLRTLGASKATARYLPRLLGEGTLACGRRFVAMSAIHGAAPPSSFGQAHRAFLATLAGHERMTVPWPQGAAFVHLRERTRCVSAALGPDCHALATAVLDEIARVTAGRPLPTCVVHGDFASWNLRTSGKGLFVFDWEYAEAAGNPLQDFLHFHLIDRATRRRALGNAFMQRLLQQAGEYAQSIFGPDSGAEVAKAAGALTLQYLLATLIFYVEASGRLEMQHPVLQAYVKLLANREAWIKSVAQ